MHAISCISCTFSYIYYRAVHRDDFHGHSVEAALESRGLHARTDASRALLASLVRADRQPLSPIFDSDRVRSTARKIGSRGQVRAFINATHRWISLSVERCAVSRRIGATDRQLAFADDTRRCEFNPRRRSRSGLRDYVWRDSRCDKRGCR